MILQLIARLPREFLLESNSSRLRFYAELFVDQSPETVWEYFTDLTKWPEWSPICWGCHIEGHEKLSVGSTINICFKVLGVTVSVPARILDVRAPELITWTGKKFGVSAIHSYRFTARDSGTVMSNEETLAPVSFPVSWLIKWWYRATGLSLRSLQGIQRELKKK